MEAYLPAVFHLPWSPDHLHAIDRIETAANVGGQFALAMPRGSGKTAMCDAATIWAAITGRRRFVFELSAAQAAANDRIETIKRELATNELLAADWPEVCYPIRCLEHIANRAAGQLYRGRPTWISWKQDRIVLPTIAGSRGSGAVIRSAGLDSNFRGASHTPPEGGRIRPDFAVIDDPQTDESARSVTQCDERERRIKGAVLGLAGVDREIAAVMPCTIICPDDLSARFLDHEQNPTWQGHVTKLLYAFPTAMKLWETYWEIYCRSLAAGADDTAAQDYLRDNWDAMHVGAEPGWAHRHPGALSAVEYAMRLYFKDPAAFAAEYQNTPIVLGAEESHLTKEWLSQRTNNHQRGAIPAETKHLVAHVDVHDKAFYWTAVAWEEHLRGHVVAYGTYPDQSTPYFNLAAIRNTIARHHPKLSLEGRLYAALEKLCHQLLERAWPVDGGGLARIERLGIDASWGDSTDTVYRFARQSRYSQAIRPMHGSYRGAARDPLVGPHRRRKRGEIAGDQWIIPPPNPIRHITFDSNYWKSRLAARLLTSLGERGSLAFHAGDHRLLIDHCLAEYPRRVEGNNRVVDEWQLHVGRDNHYWDNLVACTVLASTLGLDLAGPHRQPPKRKRAPRRATSLE